MRAFACHVMSATAHSRDELREVLQRNAEHEARVSNISAPPLVMIVFTRIRDSSLRSKQKPM
jgi:hypothetical protein